MKTLAVIKNELFGDYLRFISTSDLPSVLDNPDIPVPFSCVDSVDNANADTLMEELKNHFSGSKVKNKDFYTFDEERRAELQFMLKLIKLSSGGVSTAVKNTAPAVAPAKAAAPVVVVEEVKVVEVAEEAPVVEEVQEVAEVVAAPAEVEEVVVEVPEVATPEAEEVVAEEGDVQEDTSDEPAASVEVEMIASLGIPQGSTIHFVKDESITATLLDEKTVVYEDQTLSLIDATKQAFKKSGKVGMAVGLSNWNYQGETLKVWKDKQ